MGSVYAACKQEAEDLVLNANSRLLKSGETFRTCVLRPVCHVLVKVIWKQFLVLSKVYGENTFIRLGDDSPRFQCAYAGNIAWAFVCALHRMRTAPDGNTSPVGRAIGVADDASITSFTRFMQPFVNNITGAKMSRFYVPFWLLYTFATVCEWVCYFCRPVCSLRLPLSRLAVISMYALPTVNPQEAYQYIGYKPKYNYKRNLTTVLAILWTFIWLDDQTTLRCMLIVNLKLFYFNNLSHISHIFPYNKPLFLGIRILKNMAFDERPSTLN